MVYFSKQAPAHCFLLLYILNENLLKLFSMFFAQLLLSLRVKCVIQENHMLAAGIIKHVLGRALKTNINNSKYLVLNSYLHEEKV